MKEEDGKIAVPLVPPFDTLGESGIIAGGVVVRHQNIGRRGMEISPIDAVLVSGTMSPSVVSEC